MIDDLLRTFKKYNQSRKLARRRKIFCIGRNKTGTTSMAAFFRECGLVVAPQTPAELLIDDWAAGIHENLVRFVKHEGEAFQDIPFSLPGTYKILDRHFPGSKFILTVRDDPEKWYRSLVSFHSKMFGNGNVPVKEDLMRADYNGKGWLWKVNRMVYNTPEDDLYNRELMIRHYLDHNQQIRAYFENRPNDFIELNLKDADASRRLTAFLGLPPASREMPWENRG